MKREHRLQEIAYQKSMAQHAHRMRKIKSIYNAIDLSLRGLYDIFEPKFLLDIGCGADPRFRDGKENFNVGVDISSDLLREVEKGSLHLIRSDCFFLPFADSSFDLVTSVFVLGEHVPFDSNVAREISRILRPNGLIFFTTSCFHRRWTKIAAKRIIERILVLLRALRANVPSKLMRFAGVKTYSSTKQSVTESLLTNSFQLLSLEEIHQGEHHYLVIARKK